MTNGIVEWLSENGAYEYYFGKLQRLLADMEYTFTRKNASVFYKNFQILNLEIYGRQLYLIEVDKKIILQNNLLFKINCIMSIMSFSSLEGVLLKFFKLI